MGAAVDDNEVGSQRGAASQSDGGDVPAVTLERLDLDTHPQIGAGLSLQGSADASSLQSNGAH
nr:hypothetical protein [Nocardioides terrigena]